MKTLNDYIIKNKLNQNDLQSIYETIGRKMISNETLTESLKDGIIDFFDKVKTNTGDIVNKGKDFLKNTSKACKLAIEKIKSEAGESWEKIKDTYISIISIIDNILVNSSDLISAISKLIAIEAFKIEQIITNISLKLAAEGHGKLAEIWDLFVKMPKTQKQIMVLNMFLISSVFLQKYGLDTELLTQTIEIIKTTNKTISSISGASDGGEAAAKGLANLIG